MNGFLRFHFSGQNHLKIQVVTNEEWICIGSWREFQITFLNCFLFCFMMTFTLGNHLNGFTFPVSGLKLYEIGCQLLKFIENISNCLFATVSWLDWQWYLSLVITWLNFEIFFENFEAQWKWQMEHQPFKSPV